MARFQPLTRTDVTFEMRLEQDGIEYLAGSLATGDDEQDEADIDAIRDRLDRGDETAWCHISVVAMDRETDLTGESSLGCCSLPEGALNPTAIERRAMETHPELWEEALQRLNDARLAAHTPRVVRMCETKYLGPTDHRGSRVRARHLTTRKAATVSWDHALDSFENHAAAAERVLGRRPEFSTSVDGGGYIFGVDPKNDA